MGKLRKIFAPEVHLPAEEPAQYCSETESTQCDDAASIPSQRGGKDSRERTPQRTGSMVGRHPRFELIDVQVGDKVVHSHRHHLRTARRQEKLGRMLKDLISRHKESADSDDEGTEMDAQAAAGVQMVASSTDSPTLLSALLQELHQDKDHRDPGVVLENLLNARHQARSADRYGRVSNVVGKGSFGVVRIAHRTSPVDRNKRLLFAVKEYRRNANESDKAFHKRLAAEFCLSSSLHHINIIETLDLIRDDKNGSCGVMEYCAGGDLYSLVVVAGRLERKEADCFFKQMVRGITFMHEMGVAHRDLKPENILLTSCGCVKITDFGNAECFRMAWESEVHMSSNIAGSGPYIAPEEYQEDEFDPRAVDVWAVGVIYMAMRTGRHLWHEARGDDSFYRQYLKDRKNKAGYEPIEELESEKCRNVIYSVLDPRAGRRLTARQVLHSEWGREIVVCEPGDACRSPREAHPQLDAAALTAPLEKLQIANDIARAEV